MHASSIIAPRACAEGRRATAARDEAIRLQRPIAEQRLSLEAWTSIFLKQGEEEPLCPEFRFLCSSVSIGPGKKFVWKPAEKGKRGEWIKEDVKQAELGAKYVAFTTKRIILLDASHSTFSSMVPFDSHTVEQRLDASREFKALKILGMLRPAGAAVSALPGKPVRSVQASKAQAAAVNDEEETVPLITQDGFYTLPYYAGLKTADRWRAESYSSRTIMEGLKQRKEKVCHAEVSRVGLDGRQSTPLSPRAAVTSQLSPHTHDAYV